jgi:hypothetical protein
MNRSVEHRWNYTDRGKASYSEYFMSQYNFVHHKTHKGLTCDRSRDSAVNSQRLIDGATALFKYNLKIKFLPPKN